MKQAKRILSLLLAVMMTVGLLAVPANAAAPTSDRELKAQVLFALGLFKGYDNTGTNFGLSDTVPREQALIFLIRILGEEKAAQAWTGAQPFSDVTASHYFYPYVGYAKEKGYTNGIGGDKFGTAQIANMTQMAAFALRGLGYSEAAGDFTYPSSVPFAASLGIMESTTPPPTFTRGDALDILDGAVAAKVKNQTYTLLEKLMKSGAVTQAQVDKAATVGSATKVGKSDVPAGVYTLQCMGNNLRVTSDKLELRNSSPAQKFTVIAADGYRYIQTAEGAYLGVTAVDQGTQPVLGSTPYSWLIQKISNDVYTLRPAEKPEMLVCSGEASGKNGTQMLLWTHSDNAKHGLITFTSDKNIAVTGVRLDQTSATLAVGKTLQLTGSISPSNASIQTVTWTSSASSVAQVNSDGLVTAMKAGSATITAKTIDGSKTATCRVTVTSTAASKLMKSTVAIRNQTGKSIAEMYITDSSLAKYDAEFLKENGYASLSHNKYFTSKFEFYADTKFDILLCFADGTEAEALGLPFKKATGSTCDLTLGAKEAILSYSGVAIARVNFVAKATELTAQSKAVITRYNNAITRYNGLITKCEQLKLDKDPAFVSSMNAVIKEVNKMGTAIGDGTHVLTATQIKEFTANLNDLDTFMTEMDALIKSAAAKPDMVAESNKAISAYDTAVTAYNNVVAAANKLNLGANAEVKKIVNQMSATMTEMTAAIEARVAGGTPFTAEQVTQCNGVTADLKKFTAELQTLVDAAKKPVSKTVPITVINNTGIALSSVSMAPDTASFYDEVSNSNLKHGESVTVNIDFTGKSLVWDLQIVDTSGSTIAFRGIDFKACPTTGGTITLNWDGTNGTANLSWST